MINDIIIICMILLGFALFVRFGRFCRGLATVLLWCAVNLDALADAVEDIGPNFWRTVIATGEYQRKLARGYWQEVKEKR